MKPSFDVEAFVAAWNAADSLEQVEQELGIPRRRLSVRASGLRDQGHTLKLFSAGRPQRRDLKAVVECRLGLWLGQLGMTQRDLAERVGVAQPSVARLVAGWIQPHVGMAIRISRAIDVPVEDIWAPLPPATEWNLAEQLEQQKRRPAPAPIPTGHHRCVGCCRAKPASAFPPNALHPKLLSRRCHACWASCAAGKRRAA